MRGGLSNHTLSVKILGDIPSERKEYTIRLAPSEFRELFGECRYFLVKERQVVHERTENGGIIEYALDTYVGKENAQNGVYGVQYIEMEVQSGDFPAEPPSFCGKEVTGRPEHSNMNWSTEKCPCIWNEEDAFNRRDFK